MAKHDGLAYVHYFLSDRNAYDIPRKNLLDQVTRMRKNLLQTSHTAHTLMEQGEFMTLAFLFKQ